MSHPQFLPLSMEEMKRNLEGRAKKYSLSLRLLPPGEIDPHLIRKAELTLPAIGRSLERIKNETYGKCVDCHEHIDPRRIKLIPAAERCIGCQRLKEGDAP
jgi:RNA polymerase-binding transcription factor DksA